MTAQRMGGMTGDAVRARVWAATEERHRKGIIWRGTPSDQFDWDAAIVRFKTMLREVYGDASSD